MSALEVGTSCLPAAGIICLLVVPLQIYMGFRRSRSGYKNTQSTSKRVHIVSEILSAIKVIKFYAWEKPFIERVEEVRKAEIDSLLTGLRINAINFGLVFAAPVVSALLVLLLHRKRGSTNLTGVNGFVIVALYNTFRYPLFMLPLAVNSTSDAINAFNRIEVFLKSNQIDEKVELTLEEGMEYAILMEKGFYSWKRDDPPFVKNIDLRVKKGELVAIVGDVGSGKSSLVAAMLGQMRRIDGSCKVFGRVGYIPQEAWLLNMLLRDNIVFGKDFDETCYAEVIRVCALKRDLDLMDFGDQTEIAERGANLSGGQKQRISIARAVYDDADVIFLDDPL